MFGFFHLIRSSAMLLPGQGPPDMQIFHFNPQIQPTSGNLKRVVRDDSQASWVVKLHTPPWPLLEVCRSPRTKGASQRPRPWGRVGGQTGPSGPYMRRTLGNGQVSKKRGTSDHSPAAGAVRNLSRHLKSSCRHPESSVPRGLNRN